MTGPADRDPVLMAVADGLMDEQMLSVVPDTRGQHHVVDYLPLRDAIYAALLSERRRAEEAMRERAINVIFDGPPDHEMPRFVEVENDDGKSIRVGEWKERPDGLWALRIKGVAQ